LVEAGRKDLAQEYYKKITAGETIKSFTKIDLQNAINKIQSLHKLPKTNFTGMETRVALESKFKELTKKYQHNYYEFAILQKNKS
jgi:hypothetical protein